jgi:hypothetical protein
MQQQSQHREKDQMPWTYSQSTGQLKRNGAVVGTGYSGSGLGPSTGRNNPSMEAIADHGPIPAGQYQIGFAYSHPQKGPTTMNLTPIGHDARGRTLFRIHGNNAQNDASQGCVILGPSLRQQIATSGDFILIVQP